VRVLTPSRGGVQSPVPLESGLYPAIELPFWPEHDVSPASPPPDRLLACVGVDDGGTGRSLARADLVAAM